MPLLYVSYLYEYDLNNIDVSHLSEYLPFYVTC